MHFSTLMISTLAMVMKAFAQSSNDVCEKDLTASSQADLDKISGCETFKGDIILSSPIASAVLNGVEKIEGSFTANNITTLSSIAAPQLTEIENNLDLRILESLTSASFPALTTVGNINFITMNKIDGIDFAAGVSKASSVIISDTSLKTLKGLDFENLQLLNINNNKYLTAMDFSLKSVNELDISSTANNVEINLPFLTTAHNMTFRDAKTINIANVSQVNSTLSFVNTSVSSISVPKLSSIEGSLAIVSNHDLTNVSFPKLTQIGGGFQVANNSKLEKLSGFPELETVGGAIEFIGSFEDADLPKLDTVRGGVVVESNSEDFNCSSWNELNDDNGIRGDSYQCKGASISTSVAIDTATQPARTSGAESTDEATSTSSAGAAQLVGVESTSVFGAVLLFLVSMI